MISPRSFELDSSDLLVEAAQLAFEEILDCARHTKPLPSKTGSHIAYMLHLIADQLKGAQLCRLPDTIPDLSRRALQDLLRFCKVRSIMACLRTVVPITDCQTSGPQLS
jgi:hypothetical protein